MLLLWFSAVSTSNAVPTAYGPPPQALLRLLHAVSGELLDFRQDALIGRVFKGSPRAQGYTVERIIRHRHRQAGCQ